MHLKDAVDPPLSRQATDSHLNKAGEIGGITGTHARTARTLFAFSSGGRG